MDDRYTDVQFDMAAIPGPVRGFEARAPFSGYLRIVHLDFCRRELCLHISNVHPGQFFRSVPGEGAIAGVHATDSAVCIGQNVAVKGSVQE